MLINTQGEGTRKNADCFSGDVCSTVKKDRAPFHYLLLLPYSRASCIVEEKWRCFLSLCDLGVKGLPYSPPLFSVTPDFYNTPAVDVGHGVVYYTQVSPRTRAFLENSSQKVMRII